MGGDYYDRDVVSTTSSTGYSAEASKVIGKINSLHFSLDPTKYKEKNLISQHRNPIVFALDVTGSMGDWSKVKYIMI
jgi:Mg-chelatase subunit ChlD